MAPHQQRVIEELEQLTDRKNKLDAFIKGELYSSLKLDEQIRLCRQLVIMEQYCNVLNERIEAFAA